MKMQVTKREIEVILVLTGLEYQGVKKLIGKTSVDSRVEMGLSRQEAQALDDMYNIFHKEQI